MSICFQVSAAIHTMTAQKIVDNSGELSKDRLAGMIKQHQRRVAELENIRKREKEKPVETHMDVVARDKAEDEKRNRERRVRELRPRLERELRERWVGEVREWQVRKLREWWVREVRERRVKELRER